MGISVDKIINDFDENNIFKFEGFCLGIKIKIFDLDKRIKQLEKNKEQERSSNIMQNKEELKNFLNYLLDKVQDCYKAEAKIAVDRFLEEM